LGRQLAATSPKARAAMVRNGTLWEVVFLMRTSGLLIRLGQTKKPLPLNPGYRGLLVYTI
jgi:hypothetical protein